MLFSDALLLHSLQFFAVFQIHSIFHWKPLLYFAAAIAHYFMHHWFGVVQQSKITSMANNDQLEMSRTTATSSEVVVIETVMIDATGSDAAATNEKAEEESSV